MNYLYRIYLNIHGAETEICVLRDPIRADQVATALRDAGLKARVIVEPAGPTGVA